MIGNLGKGLLVITGAVVLGAASLGITASGAHAEVNQLNEGKLSCEVKTKNALIMYSPGSRMTITETDGTTRTFRCDGATGEWVEEIAVVGGGLTTSRTLNSFRTLTVTAGATAIAH